MRHLIVTLPRGTMDGLTKDEYDRQLDRINELVENWRRDGGVLLMEKGFSVEVIDLTAIAPGHRVCCL